MNPGVIGVSIPNPQPNRPASTIIQASQEILPDLSDDQQKVYRPTREYDYLRGHVELKRSLAEHGNYMAEHHPYTSSVHRDDESRQSDRRKSRSKSGKPRKHSSRKTKRCHLILEQNTNPPYVSPSTSSENEAMPIGDTSLNQHKVIRGRPASSQHVHFADYPETASHYQTGGTQPAGQHHGESPPGPHSSSQASHFPDLLDALSQTDSKVEPAPPPFTGIQEYELAMLEEKKRKLLQKIERLDVVLRRQNDDIVGQEIELTEVLSDYLARGPLRPTGGRIRSPEV